MYHIIYKYLYGIYSEHIIYINNNITSVQPLDVQSSAEFHRQLRSVGIPAQPATGKDRCHYWNPRRFCLQINAIRTINI